MRKNEDCQLFTHKKLLPGYVPEKGQGYNRYDVHSAGQAGQPATGVKEYTKKHITVVLAEVGNVNLKCKTAYY